MKRLPIPDDSANALPLDTTPAILHAATVFTPAELEERIEAESARVLAHEKHETQGPKRKPTARELSQAAKRKQRANKEAAWEKHGIKLVDCARCRRVLLATTFEILDLPWKVAQGLPPYAVRVSDRPYCGTCAPKG